MKDGRDGLDPRDRTAQVERLMAGTASDYLADVISVGLILKDGERIARHQPVTHGATVQYDPGSERVVYGNSRAFVISRASAQEKDSPKEDSPKKTWWKRLTTR